MKTRTRFLVTIFVLVLFSSLLAQNTENSLGAKLLSLPDVWVKKIQSRDHFTEAYEIRLSQPLDHSRPDSTQFRQRIYISHVGFDKPVLLETEGYNASRNRTKELSRILQCNQIQVEHRFFGESVPDSMDWRYLNIKQAAADHHRIVTLFKKIYPGKWIASGTSKGGQTSIFFRRFYPEDVDVTVAYVAPLNFSLQDKRIDEFFDKVGTKKERGKLIQFQRLVLENKDAILPLFRDWAWKNKVRFSLGLEKCLEYCVLEYTFSFWQYHHIDPMTVPGPGATPEELFNHLRRVVSLYSYADPSLNAPSMYQFHTELGYYGYVKKNVADLLSGDSYPNWAFAPQNTDLTFYPDRMRDIDAWIKEHGDRMIFLYGGNDPWAAPQVMLEGKTDALKVILEEGNHRIRINSFKGEQMEEILGDLERWLGISIDRSFFNQK